MSKYYLTNNELYHFGIKGQKWGLRRYQNFDGSYTQAGLERYGRSKGIYEKRKEAYEQIKKDSSKSKYEKRLAKAQVKEAKRQLNKDYKHLALDKKADEGKVLYKQGMRITDNRSKAYALTKIGGAIAVGAQIAKQYGYLDTKSANIASLASIGLTALGNAKLALDEIPNNKLRAYYSHSSKY